MTERIAIIGDIHGNVDALTGLLARVGAEFDQLVFVGDFVDRGPNSAGVIQLLLDLPTSPRSIFIAGNHDTAFLECLEDGSLVPFLAIGGAKTISSYVSSVEADVLAQLRRTVPKQHVEFLRSLRRDYRHEELLVTHAPDQEVDKSDVGFHVFGHVPQPALVPKIAQRWAAIDTGCGTLPDGRLSCLVWPTLEVIQVDAAGRAVAAR